MKKIEITWDNKIYQLVGYSIIDFPTEFKDYKETTEQMISNAKFYGEDYGCTYLDLYDKIASFIEQYANTYTPINSNYLFKAGRFIRGTFIYKLIN